MRQFVERHDWPLLRILVLNRWFRWTLIGAVSVCVFGALSLWKVWKDTPEGFEPEVRISFLDVIPQPSNHCHSNMHTKPDQNRQNYPLNHSTRHPLILLAAFIFKPTLKSSSRFLPHDLCHGKLSLRQW